MNILLNRGYTDGYYYWDRDTWRYVLKYHVALPQAFIDHIRENRGSVSLKYRLELAKKASDIYTDLMLNVNHIVQNISYEELENTYKIL